MKWNPEKVKHLDNGDFILIIIRFRCVLFLCTVFELLGTCRPHRDLTSPIRRSLWVACSDSTTREALQSRS